MARGGTTVTGIGTARGRDEGAVREADGEDLMRHEIEELLALGTDCGGMSEVEKIEEGGDSEGVIDG